MNNFSQTPPSPQSSQGLAPQQESPISTTSPGSSGSIEGRAVTPTQSANNNVQQIYEDTTTVQQAGGGAAATALPGRVAAIDNQVGDSFEQVKEKVRNAVFSLEVSTDKSSGDKAYSDGMLLIDSWLDWDQKDGGYSDLASPELLKFLNETLPDALKKFWILPQKK
jgi:hypothetical protein